MKRGGGRDNSEFMLSLKLLFSNLRQGAQTLLILEKTWRKNTHHFRFVP